MIHESWLKEWQANWGINFTEKNKIWIDHLLCISAVFCFLYLVANSFAHEEGGDVKRQHVLKEELVDVLHGLHLLSLCLETTLQQEVHTATQLVLREKQSTNMKEQI